MVRPVACSVGWDGATGTPQGERQLPTPESLAATQSGPIAGSATDNQEVLWFSDLPLLHRVTFNTPSPSQPPTLGTTGTTVDDFA